jgi:hypothetical protein
MRDPTPLRVAARAPTAPSPRPAAGRLALEAAVLAGRLGELLDRLAPDERGPIAEGRAFARAFFEALADGRPLADFAGGPLDRRVSGEPDPLDRLAEGLELSAFELDVVLLAGLAEEHEGMAGLLRGLHPRAEPRATVGLAAQLLCQSADERRPLRATLECGPAVRAGLLRLAGDGPFHERSLVLADGIWSLLHGVDAWPAALARVDVRAVTAGLEEWLDDAPAHRAGEALRSGAPRTVIVTADGEDTALHRAAALVEHFGRRALCVALPGAAAPGSGGAAGAAATAADAERLLALHALARGSVPVVRLQPPEGAPAPATLEVPGFADFPDTSVVCTRHGAGVRAARPVVAVPVERLPTTARRRLWAAVLPALAADAPILAARYALEPASAAQIAADVIAQCTLEGRSPGLDDVASAVRARSGAALAAGVRALRPTASWENLVLSPDRLALLREAVGRLIHQARVLDEWGFLRGRPGARGVRMLFAGPPGTGKTLTAEVLASALGVDLLLVDLSRVVSKWIGETEKNLAEVFDVAEQAQAVLLFDEADALFGKRTEVSDAHDRYANLETAYLLTRLERYEGLAILSTNLRQNIDAAFTRRLEYVVDFQEPGVEERRALWRCHLPVGAPLAPDLDLGQLAAHYPMVGGLIRNAAVAAAFLAAADDQSITLNHVVRAVKREYEKSGRAFPGYAGSYGHT